MNRCNIIILQLTLALAACGDNTPPQIPSDRIVYVDKVVPVQPINPSDIPPLPPQLGPRPSNAKDAADVALAGRCDAIAFVIRAWPLLLVSAGQPAAQAPTYPECTKH